MSTSRRAVAAGLLGAVLSRPALGQGSWPSRPIRLVVPFAAGTTVDTLARRLIGPLGDALDQPVLVDNRGGAGGNLGAVTVARAPADGYALLLGTIGTHGVNASLYADQGFDPLRDFRPISPYAETPNVLLARSDRFTDLNALLTAGRRRSVSFASTGTGTTAHLAMILFARATGIQVEHVPYNAPAQAVADLLAGRVDAIFYHPGIFRGQIEDGVLRPFAVTAPERAALLPGVPTTAELGWPAVRVQGWCGIFAPAGLPDAVARRLEEAMRTAKQEPALDAALVALGAALMPGGAAQLADLGMQEVERWRGMISP